MAFEAKTDWVAGDEFTAENVNRIEAGIAGSIANTGTPTTLVGFDGDGNRRDYFRNTPLQGILDATDAAAARTAIGAISSEDVTAPVVPVIVVDETDVLSDADRTEPEGSLIIDSAGDLYRVESGKAVLKGNVKGPQGDAGAKGDTGESAPAGTREQLDAGTDTTARAFTAKDLKEFVAAQIAAAAGA